MNRREFLGHYPRRPIQVISVMPEGTVLKEEVPIPADTVVCDCCNEDPGDDITVAGSRAYCRRCADKYLVPHAIGDDREVLRD